MTGHKTNDELLILAGDLDTGRLTVGREAFRQFSAGMTVELRQLVRRWKPYAAPRARFRSRFSRRRRRR